MELSKIFAERVKSRLAALDWKHERLATEVGWERASVTQYLQGKTVPKADLLLKWASALGVSTDWLLGAEEKSVPAEDQRLEAVRLILGVDDDDKLRIALRILRRELGQGTSSKNRKPSAG